MKCGFSLLTRAFPGGHSPKALHCNAPQCTAEQCRATRRTVLERSGKQSGFSLLTRAFPGGFSTEGTAGHRIDWEISVKHGRGKQSGSSLLTRAFPGGFSHQPQGSALNSDEADSSAKESNAGLGFTSLIPGGFSSKRSAEQSTA